MAARPASSTWRYTRSERQAIEEENEFRRQLAEKTRRPYFERCCVAGAPICPEFPERVDDSWNQGIICY